MNHKPTALLMILVLRHPCVSCPHACRKIVSRAVGFTFVGIMQEPTLDEVFRDLQDVLAERLDQPQTPCLERSALSHTRETARVDGAPEGLGDPSQAPSVKRNVQDTVSEEVKCLRGTLSLQQHKDQGDRLRVVRRSCDSWVCPVCGKDKASVYYQATLRRMDVATLAGDMLAVGDVPLPRWETVNRIARKRGSGFVWVAGNDVRHYLAAFPPTIRVPVELKPVDAEAAGQWLHRTLCGMKRPQRLPGSKLRLVQLATRWALARDLPVKRERHWKQLVRVRLQKMTQVNAALRLLGYRSTQQALSETGWMVELRLPASGSVASLVGRLGGDARKRCA